MSGTIINHLAYADDIVLLVETEQDLQKLIDIMHNWCVKWRVTVNAEKTKIAHFRNKQKKETNVLFKIGPDILEKTNT